jgi:Cellulase (glycosyl hydrolase family 5)
MSRRVASPEEVAAERAAEQAALRRVALRRQGIEDRLQAERNFAAADRPGARARNDARLAEIRSEPKAASRSREEIAAPRSEPEREHSQGAARVERNVRLNELRSRSEWLVERKNGPLPQIPGSLEERAAEQRAAFRFAKGKTSPSRRDEETAASPAKDWVERDPRRNRREAHGSAPRGKVVDEGTRPLASRSSESPHITQPARARGVARKLFLRATTEGALPPERTGLPERRNQEITSPRRPAKLAADGSEAVGRKVRDRAREAEPKGARSVRDAQVQRAAPPTSDGSSSRIISKRKLRDISSAVSDERKLRSATRLIAERRSESEADAHRAEGKPGRRSVGAVASVHSTRSNAQLEKTPANLLNSRAKGASPGRRSSFVPGRRARLMTRVAASAAPALLVPHGVAGLVSKTASPGAPGPSISDGADFSTPVSVGSPVETAGATVPSPSIIPVPRQSALARLSTSGSFVVNEAGEAVSLRGVTVLGFDDAGADAITALSLDVDNLSLMRDVWGLKLVRIPLQLQTLVSGNSLLSSTEVLASLDQVISAVSQAGLYVLLAMGGPAAADGAAPSGTDDPTSQAWQTLAAHYNNESAVLYEIVSSDGAPDGLQKMPNPSKAQIMVGAIRRVNQASLIFVSGGIGGADVSQLPLLFPTGDPVFNLVYTIDVSPSTAPRPDDGALSAVAQSYPLFASTWSEDGDGRLGPYVADLFGRYGIGWAASNWNAEPRLIADAATHEFAATGWGLVASRAAAFPVRPLRQPIGYPGSRPDRS